MYCSGRVPMPDLTQPLVTQSPGNGIWALFGYTLGEERQRRLMELGIHKPSKNLCDSSMTGLEDS